MILKTYKKNITHYIKNTEKLEKPTNVKYLSTKNNIISCWGSFKNLGILGLPCTKILLYFYNKPSIKYRQLITIFTKYMRN